ncbi:MAG: pentapeptide repeat-containing protein [Candidatus Thiodiazotropha sp. (ex Monitilora ramsayi)]|nr:pentapeptide repeat-containing protein [Candidatus Thiodiazotropha sp. (ex Monitilora ramsayi)]
MKKEDDKSPPSWFIRHEGLPIGPLSGAKIRGMLLDGELVLSDQISADKKKWVNIETVPEVVPLQVRAEAGDKEAQEMLAARKESVALENAEEKRFPMAAVSILILLIGVAVGVSIWLGMPEVIDSPECDASPSPGVNWRNCLLPGVDVGSASLSGANLSSAVLRQGRFSATDFTGADMRYVNLSGADLHYAQLKGAVLLGANLQHADLRGSDFSHTDLRYADLSGSLIEGAVFDAASLQGAIWVDGSTCADNSVGQCRASTP